VKVVFVGAVDGGNLVIVLVLLATDDALVHLVLGCLFSLLSLSERLERLGHWNSVYVLIVCAGSDNNKRHQAG